MAGLYDDTPGLSDGTGLWRGRLGLFSGASGFINGGGGAAYIDLYFSAGTYSVSGSNYTTLGSIPGFTFTRASLAMGYDATGKLTYGPNNLMRNSQDFSQASWAVQMAGTGSTVTKTANYAAAPDGTMTASRLQCSLGGGTTTADQSFVADGVAPPTALAVWSVWLKTNDASSKTVYARAGNTQAQWAVTGTWTRFYVLRTPADAGTSTGVGLRGGQTPACSDTVDLLAWGAQLEAVTYQTTPSTYYPTTTAAYYGPRLVYDPVTLASLGILVEEARTNICLQSNDFSTTWVAGGTGATVTTNATTSPDGTTNADLITSLGSSTFIQSMIATSTAHTYSIYAKKSTGANQANQFLLRNSTTATNMLGVSIDYDTGVITYSVGSSGATSRSVGNGWWRIELTVSSGITVGNVLLTYAGFNGSASAGHAAFFYQGQLEAGVGASSPIPTTTASVTRAADDAVMTGLSVPDGCTVMFEAYTPAFVSTDARMSLSDGTTNNRLESRVANTTSADIRSTVGGSGLLTQTVTVAAGSLNKVAASSLNGVFAGAVNGVLGSPASGGTMPTLTQLDIGKNPGSSIRYWNAPINRMRVWKSVQSVTSITQSLLLQEDGYSILQEDNSYIWLE